MRRQFKLNKLRGDPGTDALKKGPSGDKDGELRVRISY
jgi:hypothetical protein